MSLHHLDPRQAVTGAAPDAASFQGEASGMWYVMSLPGTYDHQYSPQASAGPEETESAALAVARTAAGFGHVAERACESWITDDCENPDHDNPAVVFCDCHSSKPDCARCAWPRDAHRVMP